ncbi:MAG: hypothetical protein MUC68_11655 [Burkholderiaceae bacterium]|nr:hypothetical protein [Burkholderiaceae bacterium]
MNDLRLPGLRAALPAASRPEPLLPARGTRSGNAEGGAVDSERASFDRTLQRSTEPDRSAERQLAARAAQRQADRSAQRDVTRDIAQDTPRPVDRRAERPVDRSTERAQAQPARDEPTSPMNRSTPDRGSVRAPAERSDNATSGASSTTDAASAAEGADAATDAAVARASAEPPGATAALVAASAALSAQVASAADAATDVATHAATQAATDTALITADATAAAAEPSTAALPGSAAAARAKSAARADGNAADDVGRGTINELSADLTRTPAKDRLLEDFERRFENSLARAAGAGLTGTSPLNPTSPLAVAGLPQQLAPTLSAPMLATAAVPTPLGHPAFGEDLSQRVMLFAGQRVQSAELSVTPADMGPISVSIEVRGQEAAMQFAAQADVGDRAPRDPQAGSGQGGHHGGQGSGPWSGSGGTARGAQAAADPVVRRLGLIDIRV